MQSFLPWPDFRRSAGSVDPKRRWKQVVEAHQMLVAMNNPLAVAERMRRKPDDPLKPPHERGWRNHSCTRMWWDHQVALCAYADMFLHVHMELDGNSTIRPLLTETVVYPKPSFITESFCRRLLLWSKDPAYYHTWRPRR